MVHASLVVVLLQQAPLLPAATIDGRVFDPDGRAMANVTVVPLVAGEGQDILAGKPGQSGVDGRFTITGVPPTTIVLRALPGRASMQRHPPVFFPGVLDRKEAWEIEVKPGETIALDIHVPPVFVASIKTVVSGPDGYVLDQVRVMRPASNAIRNVRVAEDGVGYSDGLREGLYAVVARASAGATSLAAWHILEIVAGEVAVELPLEPTARVDGRIATERGRLPPLEGLRVAASWTEAGVDLDPLAADQTVVDPDGSFTIEGLFGARVFRVSGLPDGWTVARVLHGRSDVTETGVRLVAGSTSEITIVIRQR